MQNVIDDNVTHKYIIDKKEKKYNKSNFPWR